MFKLSKPSALSTKKEMLDLGMGKGNELHITGRRSCLLC